MLHYLVEMAAQCHVKITPDENINDGQYFSGDPGPTGMLLLHKCASYLGFSQELGDRMLFKIFVSFHFLSDEAENHNSESLSDIDDDEVIF